MGNVFTWYWLWKFAELYSKIIGEDILKKRARIIADKLENLLVQILNWSLFIQCLNPVKMFQITLLKKEF